MDEDEILMRTEYLIRSSILIMFLLLFRVLSIKRRSKFVDDTFLFFNVLYLEYKKPTM